MTNAISSSASSSVSSSVSIAKLLLADARDVTATVFGEDDRPLYRYDRRLNAMKNGVAVTGTYRDATSDLSALIVELQLFRTGEVGYVEDHVSIGKKFCAHLEGESITFNSSTITHSSTMAVPVALPYTLMNTSDELVKGGTVTIGFVDPVHQSIRDVKFRSIGEQSAILSVGYLEANGREGRLGFDLGRRRLLDWTGIMRPLVQGAKQEPQSVWGSMIFTYDNSAS